LVKSDPRVAHGRCPTQFPFPRWPWCWQSGAQLAVDELFRHFLGFAGPRTVRTVLHAATHPKAVIIEIWLALVHRGSMYLKAPESISIAAAAVSTFVGDTGPVRRRA
jgi:hypothetical protein